MDDRKIALGTKAIAVYFAIHGVSMIAGYFIATRFFIWDHLWNFVLGNVTLFTVNPFLPVVFGAIYVIVAYGLARQRHWARIGLLMLCVVAAFFEFPVGTILAVIIGAYSFTPSFSERFPYKIGHLSYKISGTVIIVLGVVGILMLTGIGPNLVSFTSHEIQGYPLSLAGISPESKIVDIDQKIGILDVLIELTDSDPDYAQRQQDILLSEIIPHINYIINQFTVINAISVNVEASGLLMIAENKNVKLITPLKPSVLLFPYIVSSSAITAGAVISQLNVAELQSRGYTGKDITVAVIDTGMKESLFQRGGVNNIVGSFSMTGTEAIHSHGTMVASCVQTVAPDVNFLNVNVFEIDQFGRPSATVDGILRGFEYVSDWKKATGRPVIVSCSFGISPESLIDASQVAIAAGTLVREGIPVVAAAGNSGMTAKIPYQLTSPSGGVSVLSVSAVDSTGHVADFSSRGPYYNGIDKPDISAPGKEVPVMDWDGTTVTASGTSFSCPYVSGVMALLMQENSASSPEQLYDVLRDGADDAGIKGYDYEYGFGTANAGNSFTLAQHIVPEQSYNFIFFMFIIIGIFIVTYPYIRKKLR